MPRKGDYADLTGQRFGRLLVIGFAGRNHSKNVTWKCQCDCGNTRIVSSSNLRAGTKSCGCLLRESATAKLPKPKHGLFGTRIYGVWSRMIARCENKNVRSYPNYGGRGIKVCDEWRNSPESFAEWAFATGYDPDAPIFECTLDRIDVDGDYCPENCRWVDIKAQQNNKRNNHRILYGDRYLTIAEWSDITGISQDVILHRLTNGWSVEDTLTIPKYGKRQGVTITGEKTTIKEACRILGISYELVKWRLYHGWDERAAFVNKKGISRKEAEKIARREAYEQTKTI